jgi:hypothetical protein
MLLQLSTCTRFEIGCGLVGCRAVKRHECRAPLPHQHIPLPPPSNPVPPSNIPLRRQDDCGSYRSEEGRSSYRQRNPP